MVQYSSETKRMNRTATVSESISGALGSMPPIIRKSIAQQQAITRIHKQFSQVAPQALLDHVNSVYLLRDETTQASSSSVSLNETTQAKTANVSREKVSPIPPKQLVYRLVVYVDSSIAKAECNARRELIRLKYRELFNIKIDVFDIFISRAAYRNTYPFKEINQNTTNTHDYYHNEQYQAYQARFQAARLHDEESHHVLPTAYNSSNSPQQNNEYVSFSLQNTDKVEDEIQKLEKGPLRDSFERLLKAEKRKNS